MRIHWRGKTAPFIQHLPEYPAACCGDEWLNIAFLRGAIPRQEGAGFIIHKVFISTMPNDEEQIVSKNEQERAARLKEVKKRKIKKSLTWILVLAVIAAVIYGLVFWSRQEQENKPGGAVPELGRDHINVGAEHEPYNSNPPTSGQHYASPANWGIYDAPLPDEQLKIGRASCR